MQTEEVTLKNLVGRIKEILGPRVIVNDIDTGPERHAILLLAEEIEKLKAQQNSIDRRTSGLKVYGKKL